MSGRTSGGRIGNGMMGALLLAHLVACAEIVPATLESNPNLGKISSVTLIDGKNVNFSQRGATITNGNLHGTTADGPIVIPVDSIRTVGVREVSTGRTLGLVAAIAAGTLLAAYAYYIASVGTVR